MVHFTNLMRTYGDFLMNYLTGGEFGQGIDNTLKVKLETEIEIHVVGTPEADYFTDYDLMLFLRTIQTNISNNLDGQVFCWFHYDRYLCFLRHLLVDTLNKEEEQSTPHTP